MIDAFSRGGAGVSSRGTTRTLEVADNYDFSVRKHGMRVGALFEADNFRNFDSRNAAGTFTFGSLEAFNEGRPNTFTQRLGQVDTEFTRYQLGIYWQDDVRLHRSLTVSVGVRQEMQNHVDDKINPMPRLGFTWNAFGSRTLVRGGYGVFHDWYDSNLYDQTLRVDGLTQRDLLILNPGYPDPIGGVSSIVLPGGRVQAAPDLKLPYIQQASIGVEHPITPTLNMQASYMFMRGRNQMRSRNINAPDAAGVRPEPNIGTVTQIESTGRTSSDRLNLSLNYRVPAKRIFMNVNYTLANVKNVGDNALVAARRQLQSGRGVGTRVAGHPPSFQRDGELPDVARAASQHQHERVVRGALHHHHRARRQQRRRQQRPARGRRPQQRARRVAVGPEHADLAGVRIWWSSRRAGHRRPGRARRARRRAGHRAAGSRPGRPTARRWWSADHRRGGPGGGPGFGGDGANQRFSVEFYVQGFNVLNRTNYVNFSGNLQSPFFGLPTSAAQARRVEVGMQFRF